MTELSDIACGSTIQVKVVKQPTNAAAVKTLVRVLHKDEAVKADNRRLESIRHKHYSPRPRGGRLYGGHLVKQHPVKANVGESGTVIATVDVLRDLGSVSRFIEVTPA